MELKILEEGKNFIKIELLGEMHTLPGALKTELSKDPHVEVAGYKQEHPLINNSVLIVRTDGKLDPLKAINNCVINLKKKHAELLSLFKKL